MDVGGTGELGVHRKEREGSAKQSCSELSCYAKTLHMGHFMSFKRTVVLVLVSFMSISLTPKCFTFSQTFLKLTQ